MKLPNGTDKPPPELFCCYCKKTIIIIITGEAKEKEKASGIISAKYSIS